MHGAEMSNLPPQNGNIQTAEYSGPQKKDIQERNKLIAIVQAQSAEIEALKREIEMLIRKQLPPIRKPYMAGESEILGVGGMTHGGVPVGTFVEEEGMGVPTSAEPGVRRLSGTVVGEL